MKVKKISNGKYRVYGVWQGWKDTETRYAKKCDAEQFAFREGGYLIWEDFDSEAQAQAHLNEKMGATWW